MPPNLRLLIIDAYDAAGRADIQASGANVAGELYRRIVQNLAPRADLEVTLLGEDQVPQLEGWDGIIWTGSSLTIHRPEPAVVEQIDLARRLFEIGTPQFGSCWAIQLATVAAGGACGPNPKGREFGIARKIALSEAGLEHPMHRGRSRAFDGFAVHADMVTTLPEGATLLASNHFTLVQSLDVNHLNGSFWAVQYHPEYDLREVACLADCRRAALITQGTFKDDNGVDTYSEAMKTLQTDPMRADLAWQLGVDQDVLDPVVRQTELRNWLDMILRGKAA